MTNKTKKIKQAEGNTNRHNNRKFTVAVGWGGRLASGSDNMRLWGGGEGEGEKEKRQNVIKIPKLTSAIFRLMRKYERQRQRWGKTQSM